MMHETLISEVLIIRILIFSLESDLKIRAATPEWLLIPAPTMEILAIFGGMELYSGLYCLASFWIYDRSQKSTISTVG